MTATTRTGHVRRWMLTPVRISAALSLAWLLAALVAGAPAVAQDGGLTVMVGDKTYQVAGTAVSAKDGGATDQDTVKKARFAARVLDEQILHSDYNKTQFDAAHRAVVYADALSERRIEPWRAPLLNASGEAGLADAKAQFKEWAGKLANDPRELALAVARKDTLDGIAAYRENAVIYRKVTKRNGILTFDEALRFAQNQGRILRMAYARAMEDRLANGDGKTPDGGAGSSSDAQRQAGGAGAGEAGKSADAAGKDAQASGDGSPKEPLQQKVQNDVVNKVDKDVKTAEDLDHSYDKLREIVTAETTDLKNNKVLDDYAKTTKDIAGNGERQIARYESAAPEVPGERPQLPVIMFNSPTIRMTYTPPPRYRAPPRVVQHLRQNEYSFGGKHKQYYSDVTGTIDSKYKPVTRQAAQTIVGKYKSIPGGVTLEGSSADLARVKSVTYDDKTGAFIINDDLVYLSPVGIGEFADIARALAKDDKLGVSLGSAMSIVYGSLPPQSSVAVNLKLVDKFMGAIAFGNRQVIPDYRFAPGYEGRRVQVSSLAVYFNINGFRFTEDDSGELKRTGVNLDTTLVPLAQTGNADGGHRPDFDRIDRNDVPEAYAANLKNMQDNIGYYARERIVRRAIAYGEAAAFARAMRDNGVQTDLVKWSPGVATLTPSTAALPGGGSGDCAAAAVHWSSAESIGTRAAFEDHLQRFPNCAFATLAAARMAALDKKAPPKRVAEQPKRKRQAAPREASGETPAVRGQLDCSNPNGLFACMNRALGTLPGAQ